MQQKYSRGVITIELFISIVILVILMSGSLALLFPALRSVEVGRQRVQAEFLLWEEEEAIRQVRNEAWSNLIPGTYYAQYNPTSNPPTTYQGWQLYPGIGTKNGFTEYLVISVPYRVSENSLSDTSGSGGTQDPSERKIVYTVSWLAFGTTYSETLTSYLSDWKPF